jgi:hypothetical protein
VAILTAMFGGCDAIRPQAAQDIDVEWICVTDDAGLIVPPPFRKVVKERTARPAGRRAAWIDANRSAKRYKLTPGAVTDRDHVIWIDANMEVTAPSFAREALASVRDGIALYRHPRRACIYEEAEASLGAESQDGKYEGLPIREQVERYRADGHPEQGGLYACGVLAWDTTDPRARALGRDWLEEIERWTVQDQLSFPVVTRQLGIEPGIFPGELLEERYGSPDFIGNRWLRIWPHLR